MKVLVFQVWKSCFQHVANGYLVIHSPNGIFDVTIAFLDPEKFGFWCTICHTFDILDHLIMHYCVDVGNLGKWRRVRIAHTSDDFITQFRDPHTPMIAFRHANKCWYSAATYSKTRGFLQPLLQHYYHIIPEKLLVLFWMCELFGLTRCCKLISFCM